MSHAPLALWLFWVFAAAVVISIVVALLAGRLRPGDILTDAEWQAALKLIGTLVLVVTMIYYQNGHFSDQTAFIYGRF